MPANTTELIGLLTLMGFWLLVLSSLRGWGRRVPNATDKLPGGVEGMLFASTAWAASAAAFDLAAFGLALGHVSALRAQGLDAGEALLSAALNAGAAAGLIAAAGLLLLGRRPWVPRVAGVLMTAALPVLETVLWWTAQAPWPDYLTFLWTAGFIALIPLRSERARNTYGF